MVKKNDDGSNEEGDDNGDDNGNNDGYDNNGDDDAAMTGTSVMTMAMTARRQRQS